MGKLGYIDYRFFQWIRDSGAGNPIIYNKSNDALLIFSKLLDDVYIKGAGFTATDDLKIQSNQGATYPYLWMEGEADITLAFINTANFILMEETNQVMKVYHDGTYPTWEGGSLTGQHLKFKANSIDDEPYIYFSGSGWITLCTQDVANGIIDYYKSAQHVGRFSEGTNEFKIESKGTNFDLTLQPDGSGYVRFGTYNAITTEVNAGYMPVKDLAGNVRKVCIVA